MLIQTQKWKLGDGQLDEVQSVARLKELNRNATEKNKIPDQEVFESKMAALGLPMQPNELIRRIQQLNPKIVIEPGGAKNAVAVRWPELETEGVDAGKIVKRYITGFYIDQPLPEWSCVLVDNRGLPVREVRGWRTVLLPLIINKCLTLRQVETKFGKALGRRAMLWDRSIQAQRLLGNECAL